MERHRVLCGFAVALATLLPAPLMAQDDLPALDSAITQACLDAQAGDEGRPESCVGQAADACMEAPGGYTTVGMSSCLMQEHAFWDDLLNSHYEALMTAAEASDSEMAALSSAAPAQAPELREMQRAWIGFRDAACRFEQAQWGGGTGAGPAGAQCMMALTARQALWLGGYLDRN